MLYSSYDWVLIALWFALSVLYIFHFLWKKGIKIFMEVVQRTRTMCFVWAFISCPPQSSTLMYNGIWKFECSMWEQKSIPYWIWMRSVFEKAILLIMLEDLLLWLTVTKDPHNWCLCKMRALFTPQTKL